MSQRSQKMWHECGRCAIVWISVCFLGQSELRQSRNEIIVLWWKQNKTRGSEIHNSVGLTREKGSSEDAWAIYVRQYICIR